MRVGDSFPLRFVFKHETTNNQLVLRELHWRYLMYNRRFFDLRARENKQKRKRWSIYEST